MASTPPPTAGIADFFRGRHVLVTGPTGFLGKVLVEKLVRSCPDVGRIYLLLRPKRGRDVLGRFQDYVNHMAFDPLRKSRPDFASKLLAVSGDVTSAGLGLDQSDTELLANNVQVVFHCAANVRFDVPMRAALETNTLGAQRVLTLAGSLKKLEAYIHVSTAFCHCDVEVVEEKTYPGVVDVHDLLETLTWIDDEALDAMTPKLLGNLPNTYVFSKNLGEQLVAEQASRLPIGLARPAIVTCAYLEPTPGYIDNMHGPMALLVAAGKGVLRSMHCQPGNMADLIPVDLTVNSIIALAWQVATTKPAGKPLVMNITVEKKVFTWTQVLERGRVYVYKYPFSQCIWYPDGSITTSRLKHNLRVVFFHFLPAYIIDVLAAVAGYKPFMVDIQKRIQGGLGQLHYFANRKWEFATGHLATLRETMTAEDNAVFYTDTAAVDTEAFAEASVLATRKLLLKEDETTLPWARRHHRRLYWLDRATTWLFFALVVYMLFSYCAPLQSLSDHTLGALRSAMTSSRSAQCEPMPPLDLGCAAE